MWSGEYVGVMILLSYLSGMITCVALLWPLIARHVEQMQMDAAMAKWRNELDQDDIKTGRNWRRPAGEKNEGYPV